MMFYNLNRFNEHRLNYPAYSFVHILANVFDLTTYQKERLLCIANEVWDDKAYLFNAVRYENLLTGIMIYVLDEEEQEPVDIADFARTLYGECDKDLIQMYNVYQIITNLYVKTSDNSELCGQMPYTLTDQCCSENSA